MAEPSLQLGNGNWAVKSNNLLAYHKVVDNFYADELTFTRASTGTRVNADGLIEEAATNIARVDYTNNASGQLLLEPQRTNTVLQSENLTNLTSWPPPNIGTDPTVTSGYLAPDGTTNAVLVSNPNGDSFLSQDSPTSATAARTIYARTVSGSGDIHLLAKNDSVGSLFTITEEWQRLYVNSATAVPTRFYAVDFRGSSTLTEVILWGAQSEEATYPTSYIPTSGTTVTRIQDTSSTTGLTSVIGQTEGTFHVKFDKEYDDTYRFITLSDGTSNNRLTIYTYNNDLKIYSESGGVPSFDVTIVSAMGNGTFNVAFAYKVNDFEVYVNGVSVYTKGAVSVPIGMSDLKFSQWNGTQHFFNYKIDALTLYKTRLTNTELATLTTL